LLPVGITAFFGERVDSSVVLGVVLINAVVGFLQESKAQKAIERSPKWSPPKPTVLGLALVTFALGVPRGEKPIVMFMARNPLR